MFLGSNATTIRPSWRERHVRSGGCHDNSTNIVLEHSGIQLRVARTTFEAAVPDQDVSAGFPPDYRVVPTITEILSGDDPQMDLAVRLGEEGN